MFNKIIGQAVVDKIIEKRTNAADVKTSIVINYFEVWAKFVKEANQKNGMKGLAYSEVFSNAGLDDINRDSSPISILRYAVEDSWLSQSLKTVFFDEKIDRIRQLKEEIQGLQQEKRLVHQPKTYYSKADNVITQHLQFGKFVPSLFLMDPFSTKGLSKKMLLAMVRDWGCDIILFFNNNRFSKWLERKEKVWTIDNYLGNYLANNLRQMLRGNIPREEAKSIVMKAFQQSLENIFGVNMVPFQFLSKKEPRINHHMFFLSRHFMHYHIMKEIMARASTRMDYGVPSMTYNPIDLTKLKKAENTDKLTALENDLTHYFRGKTLSVWSIYVKHSVGKPYTLQNYKDALIQLEVDRRLKANPFVGNRPFRNGYSTMANKTIITFPAD
ncbi:MAG: hypothetical protein A2Y40_02170 [Candidatus Margulisbacteria bacterium GWF2_35_9]|nr:MAG: hypothetical protein A2Y40_02170 [Candidatus Margulisbacteria bacterium GWF2_35_9]